MKRYLSIYDEMSINDFTRDVKDMYDQYKDKKSHSDLIKYIVKKTDQPENIILQTLEQLGI